MDTSETYIKMSDCEEIQALRPDDVIWQEGDYYCWNPPSGIIITLAYDCWCDSESHAQSRDKGDIWLPRQDQLQKMVGAISHAHLLEQLNSWIMTTTSGLFPALFNSMEQLWLAFVMWENHQKKWDGEEWVLVKVLQEVDNAT